MNVHFNGIGITDVVTKIESASIDSGRDLTKDERERACEWVETLGYNRNDVEATIRIGPGPDGGYFLFGQQFRRDENGNAYLVNDEWAFDPIRQYIGRTLPQWFLDYLKRTGGDQA